MEWAYFISLTVSAYRYLVANSIEVVFPAASAVVATLLRDEDPRSESMYINDSKPELNPSPRHKTSECLHLHHQPSLLDSIEQTSKPKQWFKPDFSNRRWPTQRCLQYLHQRAQLHVSACLAILAGRQHHHGID